MKLSSQVFSTLLMSAKRMLDLILCSRSLPGTRESMGGARATRRAAAAAAHGDEAPEGRKERFPERFPPAERRDRRERPIDEEDF